MTKPRHDTAPSSVPPSAIPLDPTGVPGLDEVLGGGIQRGSLAIVAGPPGAGKTILAHQIACAAARRGRHTTVLTAFSEPTNKLIAHMRSFAFFDQGLLGQSLEVLSIQQFLQQGLAAAAGEIVAAVRAANAELVVLDGFRGVRETAARPEEARQFIYEVSNRLSLLGITLLLTSEANVRDVAFFPEATTADVLLGLTFDIVDASERRTLEVLKVRGAAPLSGLHAVCIDDGGVTIFPRLEARVTRLAGVNGRSGEPRAGSAQSAEPPDGGTGEPANDLVGTGVAGLDALLGGGLARGGSMLVVGERGAGKTLLGLQFALEGTRLGQPAIFVGFRETAEQLRRKAAPFEWARAFESAREARTLTILRTPPIELRADVLADDLLAQLDETGARRMVLDDSSEIERALVAAGYAHRSDDFMAALIEALRLRGVTTLLTRQAAADRRSALEFQLGASATLTENLIWLRQRLHGGRIGRSLAILQTAASGSPDAWHAVTIQPPEGIAVSAQVEGRHGRRSSEMRRPQAPDEEGRDDDA